MARGKLPLEEVSIAGLFNSNETVTYEIPIYQRNYAWEQEEISALVQDVYDAYHSESRNVYYIGTLVSYHKGDQVYEVIDGQQRLTTIRLLLDVLGYKGSNKLTYRARKKSDATLNPKHKLEPDEKDIGIENGYKYAKKAVEDLVSDDERNGFCTFFLNNVHIIHYQVPKDIDLNHYFEVMNSRGEQLEKHEIVKANLMQKLDTDEERKVFNRIWECCSEMSTYTQQNLRDMDKDVFGETLDDFRPDSFWDLLRNYENIQKSGDDTMGSLTISEILRGSSDNRWEQKQEKEKKDSFQPIIDFPNFLLIVLKIMRMEEASFSPVDLILDDKELLKEFDQAKMDADKVRKFAFSLLKARFLLDNYVVHHSREEDTIDSNPWKLQVWHKAGREGKEKARLRNLTEEPLQGRLAQLLSMFEVSFTARQRKNYLFYCLYYLMTHDFRDVEAYASFVEALADSYFYRVYLVATNLNAINTPIPGSFDSSLIEGKQLNTSCQRVDVAEVFTEIYGDGTEASRGIPLFIFNYLDYKLWALYMSELKGNEYKEGHSVRNAFFQKLGCEDFGLQVFERFYFSRTRRSLEHFYPQANATGENGALDQNQINCLGNYAMIGSEANSSGSNWSPESKLHHYLDSSGKISLISVASLKFMIMMQKCREHEGQWGFDEIQEHQRKMVEMLAGGKNGEAKAEGVWKDYSRMRK